MSRKINAAGLALIKAHEGLRLDAYQDVVGVWTIGYGHTGDVKAGQKITAHQADAILALDLETAERAVEELTAGIPLTDNQFAALVSFVFNLGAKAFRGSTLRLYLSRRDFGAAAREFARWNHAGGKVVADLTKRRADERALFEKP